VTVVQDHPRTARTRTAHRCAVWAPLRSRDRGEGRTRPGDIVILSDMSQWDAFDRGKLPAAQLGELRTCEPIRPRKAPHPADA
jgi:hypothetical protein